MGIKTKRNNTKNRSLLAKKSKNPKKRSKKTRESKSISNRKQRIHLCWNCGNSLIITPTIYVNVYFCESCRRYWKSGSKVFPVKN
jgi:ribosomal protein L37AE/L43A